MMEVIQYGDIEQFKGISSVSEFYDRLGLLARLEAGEIKSVSYLTMSETDHNRLQELIKQGLKRRYRGVNASMAAGALMADWLNLGPGCDEEVPVGEVWWNPV